MPLRVIPPQNYEFPEAWRPRIAEINYQLAHPTSALALEFATAKRIADERGHPWAEQAVAEVVERHRALFPGVAGERLAWSTFCGSAPPLQWKEPGEPEPRLIFEEPVPDFRPTFSRTGKNAYAPRREASSTDKRLRGGPSVSEVLALMREGLSSPEIARRLGQSEDWLRKLRYRLRRRKDLRITSAWGQRVLSLYERGLRALTRERAADIASSAAPVGEVEQPLPNFEPGGPTVRMPIVEAEAMTGFTGEQLKQAGVQTYVRRMPGDEAGEEYASVPNTLLIHEPTLPD